MSTLPTDLLTALRRPGSLAEMLAATRLLLGAWDATLHHWSAPTPLPTTPATVAVASADPGAADDALHVLHQASTVAASDTLAAMPSLSVQLLDGLQLSIGQAGTEVESVPTLPRGKARAVLLYLLLHRRRPTSRDRLCSLFWPDSDPGAARNNLHVTLHRLRRHFRDMGHADWLHHTPEGYQLLPQGELWLDAEHFSLHAQQGERAEQSGDVPAAILHYELAAALYRSHLVEDSEREPVLRALSQGLRDQLNLVLERLSTLREAHGQVHACLRVAQRHLQLDDCNEAAHRRLMRGYARLGQPRLAEQQYRACVQALLLRLGLPPTEETRALFREISERRTP